MAKSRLFSSASAMASSNDRYSLPSLINCSMRGVLENDGDFTSCGMYGPIGLGKCLVGRLKSAGFLMEVFTPCTALGAFGAFWSFCANTLAGNAMVNTTAAAVRFLLAFFKEHTRMSFCSPGSKLVRNSGTL